jgi:methylated-DNA-[protein]-cysteine S-methyltransferase
VKELNLYLAGKLQEFSVPIQIPGTEFQVQVFEAVRNIPYGKTWTCKQVAEAIGHPKAERAVGNALHNNPLQVIIPCHRVVTSRGKIGGYTLGTDLKRRLLCMEGAIQNELDLE